jgi:hypothetical protein
MTARKIFKVKGTTDGVTECELCGRVDLKGTIVLAPLDEDGNEEDVVYYGTSCGAKAAGWTTKEVQDAAKKADREAHEAKIAAIQEEERKFCAARDAWIAENIGSDALDNPRKYGYRSSVMLVEAFSQATGIR